jgi:CRISPR/Cas system CMR-associated protein Cmr1 (group 7 of RAMP superfamily)
MNPNEPLDEQIDLLPYDKRWEFPRNRLTLGIINEFKKKNCKTFQIIHSIHFKGKQLGVGCFARVVEAQAIGINDGSEDSVSTVAVKMVRSRTNAAGYEGLISEFETNNRQGLLPLKWMAIESLTDRIWSSRSDF